MTKLQGLVLAILGILNLLVLGGGAVLIMAITEPAPAPQPAARVVEVAPTPLPATPAPTATPIPPTATRPLPTATWVIAPSTLATRAPTETPNATAAAILAAMAKSNAATAYRMEMDMSVTGELTATLATTGTGQSLSMVNMSGEVNGTDSHFVLKGLISMLLTGDPAKALEMTESGGKSYVRGPLPLLGAKEDRWYVLSQGQTGTRNVALQSGDTLANLRDQQASLNKLALVATETLDGQKCSVFGADKETALNTFLQINPDTELSRDQLTKLKTNLSKAEFKIWTCPDGYFHQLRLSLESTGTGKSGQEAGIKLVVHVYDFNAKLTVTAPANALTASTNLFDVLTPTVVKKSPTPVRTGTVVPKPVATSRAQPASTVEPEPTEDSSAPRPKPGDPR